MYHAARHGDSHFLYLITDTGLFYGPPPALAHGKVDAAPPSVAGRTHIRTAFKYLDMIAPAGKKYGP